MSEKVKSKFESRTDCRICGNCRTAELVNDDGMKSYRVECGVMTSVVWMTVDQISDGCCQFFREAA